MISIEILDHSGHTTLETDSAEAARARLTSFLDEYAATNGGRAPLVWARRAGQQDGDLLDRLADPRHADLEGVTQLVCQPAPLIGG